MLLVNGFGPCTGYSRFEDVGIGSLQVPRTFWRKQTDKDKVKSRAFSYAKYNKSQYNDVFTGGFWVPIEASS